MSSARTVRCSWARYQRRVASSQPSGSPRPNLWVQFSCSASSSKAADFRKGYKDWRKKKSKGARGETKYLLDKEKLHAHDHRENLEALEIPEEDVGTMSRTSSMEKMLSPTAPSRGNLQRTNSIIDGSEMEKAGEGENWLKFYVNPYSGMEEANKTTEPVSLNMYSCNQDIPRNVRKPMYKRPKDQHFTDYYMCHLGVGGFHRSHQAVYTDDLLNMSAELENQTGVPSEVKKWGITGIGLMDWDRKMYNILQSQDTLYTLLSRGHSGSEARIIGSIVDFMFAPDDHQAVIDKIAHESTRIVSLTVTEKGYCQNVNGDLDTQNNAFVKSDLECNLTKPKTAIGMICAGLRKRMEDGVPSFTVLSCDNLPENGDKIKHVVLQMAELISPELRAWVGENTTFPNTMVDRITPMTEMDHIEILARDYMLHDAWPVIAEDFSQWVIEDNFCNGAPEWDKAGALFVKDVTPYEFMKLRLLNGGHSSISYISVLCGYNYVDDAMADPLITKFVRGFFDEMAVTLLPVPGVDITAYQQKLVERFGNPYIKDKLTRLAEDGSKKMSNTMREGVIELHERQLPYSVIALANAAWIKFMSGEGCNGEPIVGIKDPAADTLKALALEALEGVAEGTQAPKPEKYMEEVFGSELVALEGFMDTLK
ncbi:unnamed protein product, partial [Discosporangium mesarthrocarpum]